MRLIYLKCPDCGCEWKLWIWSARGIPHESWCSQCNRVHYTDVVMKGATT